MPTFATEYRYDTRDAERAAVRPAHRTWLRTLLEERTLLASGPFVDGSGALLLLRANSAAEAADVLDADPFHTAGLLAERTIREWDPVMRFWE